MFVLSQSTQLDLDGLDGLLTIHSEESIKTKFDFWWDNYRITEFLAGGPGHLLKSCDPD